MFAVWYWHFMPEYVDRNALGADGPLPNLYLDRRHRDELPQDAVGQT